MNRSVVDGPDPFLARFFVADEGILYVHRALGVPEQPVAWLRSLIARERVPSLDSIMEKAGMPIGVLVSRFVRAPPRQRLAVGLLIYTLCVTRLLSSLSDDQIMAFSDSDALERCAGQKREWCRLLGRELRTQPDLLGMSAVGMDQMDRFLARMEALHARQVRDVLGSHISGDVMDNIIMKDYYQRREAQIRRKATTKKPKPKTKKKPTKPRSVKKA